MLNLLKNEFYKVFHKKSTYIVLIIIFLYAILVNYIYNSETNFSNDYYYSSYELSSDEENNYKQVINNYNPENSSKDEYVYAQTMLEMNQKVKEYKSSWQREIIENSYYSIVYNYYDSLVYNNTNEEIKKTYKEYNNAFKENDWKYFVNIQIIQEEVSINELKQIIENASEKEINNYKIELFVHEVKLDLLKYRLEENVSYGNDYLNNAINSVENNAYSVKSYEFASEKEKSQYEYSVSEFYQNKYILETKEDTNNTRTLREMLKNFMSEYYFLMLVFVIMIAGGIVSDEFNKGTIKSLLITPYKRGSIPMAKFITSLLMIPIVVLFTFVVEMIVGGVVFGFGSLGVNVVSYNLSTSTLEIMSVFHYMLLQIVTTLPQIILLTTLAFAVSTIFNNTAFAIAITFSGIIASELINSFASIYKIKLLNYFVTTCWDFKYYLFGGTNPFGISLPRAIITCGVYFMIMIVVSYIVFKKKDIKNI